jgi:hypothetical protein
MRSFSIPFLVEGGIGNGKSIEPLHKVITLLVTIPLLSLWECKERFFVLTRVDFPP